MNIDIFSNQTLVKSADCFFKTKITFLKDLKFNDVIYQKELLINITSSSMEKKLLWPNNQFRYETVQIN